MKLIEVGFESDKEVAMRVLLRLLLIAAVYCCVCSPVMAARSCEGQLQNLLAGRATQIEEKGKRETLLETNEANREPGYAFDVVDDHFDMGPLLAVNIGHETGGNSRSIEGVVLGCSGAVPRVLFRGDALWADGDAVKMTEQVYLDGDAHCCPSIGISHTLAVQGDRVSVGLPTPSFSGEQKIASSLRQLMSQLAGQHSVSLDGWSFELRLATDGGLAERTRRDGDWDEWMYGHWWLKTHEGSTYLLRELPELEHDDTGFSFRVDSHGGSVRLELLDEAGKVAKATRSPL